MMVENYDILNMMMVIREEDLQAVIQLFQEKNILQQKQQQQGEVVHRVKAHELQEKGVLSACHVNIIQTQEWKEFESYQAELTYLVTNEERMTFISDKIHKISQNGNTLVLVDRIESGEFICGQIQDAVFISGEVKTKDRKE